MNTAQLERECRTYTRYLIGQAPSDYVIEKYVDSFQKSDVLAALKPGRFDEFLVEISSRRPFWAGLADSYARVFYKNSVVRKKLIVTLALLECAPPSFEALDRTDGGGPLGTVARLGVGATRYAITLLAAFVIFTPVRLGLAVTSKRHPVAAER
jgi:hypothetical protein